MAIDSAVRALLPAHRPPQRPPPSSPRTMPATHSVSVSLYVGAGSRYERESEAGVSHFVRHTSLQRHVQIPVRQGGMPRPSTGSAASSTAAPTASTPSTTSRPPRPPHGPRPRRLFELVRRPLMDPARWRRSAGHPEELAMVADRRPARRPCCSTPSSGPTTRSVAMSPGRRRPSRA